jgi:ADP-ribosylglycohydrolase
MSFLDRATASFLGLALGDAFGRTLEFVQGPSVRTQPVPIDRGRFDWTDDTHMALYLAEAVLSQGPDRLKDDTFGEAVGEAFSRWLDDPLTPSTAPGSTCMAGVRNWRRTRDWRSSGVRESDGCGAVMRVVSIGIGIAGEELDRAASISARLTHGHPNAAEAAVATCRLLRAALERGRLDGALVEETIRGLPSHATVAASLRAALDQAKAPWEGWLDERAIPAGDGGWRSPSALGLAVAAALRWGRDFATAVEKAARIDGDSDSVAALTGMFLGAGGGTAVLPAAWCVAVREREKIETMARSLALRGEPWVAVADLHGRRDRLETLVAWGDARMSGWRLALLGDYVDNGPDIPGLLDLILRLKSERSDALVAIAGNHDVVCSRSLETLGTEEGEFWAHKWKRGHWNFDGDTPSRYGAPHADIAGLAARMPPDHHQFLAGLPWFFDTGRWVFVHAGLEVGPIAPQLDRLRERPARPNLHFEEGLDRGLPATIRGHTLDNTSDARWDRVVVTAHSGRHRPPAWEGPNRIALHANDNPAEDVCAVLLPDRVYLRLRAGGEVAVVP